MAGRNVAFVQTIPGRCALSVNDAGLPAPKGWAWVRLGDIARLESGHTPSRNHPEYWDGDIAWIGIKDAREHHGGIINDTSQHVTQAGLDNSAARLLPADTVCLSRTASVGYVVIMGRPMATSQDFVNWVCSPAIEPAYLKWILLAEGDEGLRKFGKGTTHTTIYFPEVQAFHACVAPLNEQRRIVAKLDAVFAQTRAAKARLERLPALIEKLKRSILAAAFRGDLSADWRAANPDVEPASGLLARISRERSGARPALAAEVSTAPYSLPKTWAWASLQQLADHGRHALKAGPFGSALKKSDYTPHGQYKVYGQEQVIAGDPSLGDYFIDESKFRELEACAVRAGDVLVSLVGTIGRSLVLPPTSQPGIINPRLVKITLAAPGLHPKLLQRYLQSPFAKSRMSAASHGGTMEILNLGILRGLPVPLAPPPEQTEIVSRIYAMFTSLDELGTHLGAYTSRMLRLEQSALAKAFRGELVPQDPADEPAEVLLERIRAAKAEVAPVARRPRAAAATTYAAPPVTLAQAAESGPLFKHALDRQARVAAEPAALDLVVAALQQSDGRLTAAAIAQATGLDPAAIRASLKELVAAGQVRTHGKARGTTYEWIA